MPSVRSALKWAMVWAVLAGRPLPAALPAAWRERWTARAGEPPPPDWLDEPATPDDADAAEADRETVDRLFALVPWLRAAAFTGS